MTDNEIKQALPFLAQYCKDEYNDIKVDEVLLGAFDLINRQQAEKKSLEAKIVIQKGLIDHQQAEIEKLNKIRSRLFYTENGELLKIPYELIEKIKKASATEAIKEFLNKFDIEYCKTFSANEISFMKEFKKQFLKEPRDEQ